MREDEPARWLAIWPAHMKAERLEWELPFLGAEQDDQFFHYGGQTRMGMCSEDEVLKDYGEMTVDEWDEQGGDDQWYADFPPVASLAEDYSGNVESWIDPDGEIYLCHTEGHEILALRLCRRFGIVDPDSALTRDGDLLEKRGWIKLYWDKVILDTDDLTQKQLDALFDILLVLERKDEAKFLCKSIRRALNIKAKIEPETEEESEPLRPRLTDEEMDEIEGDVHAFQRRWLGFVPDEYPTAEEQEELDEARAELLGVICDAVAKRPEPEPEPEPEIVATISSGAGERRKPFVLTDQPYVEVTVRAYCTRERTETGSRGISCFKTFCTEVSDDDDEVYGMIGGGTGFVTLSDRRRDGLDGEEFFIRHRDLWYAYQRALNARFGGDFPENEEQEQEG